jgi:tetratricopeptide (TPR) repeat protein
VALVLVGAYHRSPVDPQSASEAPAAAQAAYWKGLHQLGKYNPVSLQRACEHLEEAVSIEPRFASARAALADCYNRMAAWGLASPQPAYAKAIREAELALAVDPREARAHLALGEARLFLHWDWDGAKRAHLRALELAPELPLAHKSYALLLVSKGRVKEALRHMEESRRLAPLDIRIQTQYGEMLYLARRYHDATAQLELAVGMDPEYPAARKYLSDAYAQIGRYEAAAAQFEDWLALVGVDAGERSEAARILARHGPAGVARRTISRHNAQACENYGAPHKLAASHAALNDPGRSVEWLEQAYAQRDPRLMFLKVDPQFDRVRSDRRFQELLMRIGL